MERRLCNKLLTNKKCMQLWGMKTNYFSTNVIKKIIIKKEIEKNAPVKGIFKSGKEEGEYTLYDVFYLFASDGYLYYLVPWILQGKVVSFGTFTAESPVFEVFDVTRTDEIPKKILSIDSVNKLMLVLGKAKEVHESNLRNDLKRNFIDIYRDEIKEMVLGIK